MPPGTVCRSRQVFNAISVGLMQPTQSWETFYSGWHPFHTASALGRRAHEQQGVQMLSAVSLSDWVGPLAGKASFFPI